MFALCSAAAGLLGCEAGWVDGSYAGIAEYGNINTNSEADCFALATAAHPDVTWSSLGSIEGGGGPLARRSIVRARSSLPGTSTDDSRLVSQDSSLLSTQI